MKAKLRLVGLRLRWNEVVTVNSALQQAIKKCPSGSFISRPLDVLSRRVARRVKENDEAIEKMENDR